MMFRRRLRRTATRALARQSPSAEIERASQLLSAGEYEQAALIFTQTATAMGYGRRPRPAANLHAQAAYAWVDAGNPQRALNQAQAALAIYNRRGLGLRASAFRANFIRYLREHALNEAAASLEQGRKTPSASQTPPAAEARRGRLPAACSQCGAPLRSDLLEWIDDHSAVCDFCESTVYTEE
jgi:hypothetical protein